MTIKRFTAFLVITVFVFSLGTLTTASAQISISEPSPAETISVKAYPNPIVDAGTFFTIETNDECNLGIYNITGQKIVDVELISKSTCWQAKVSTGNLEKGFYVIYGNSPAGKKIMTIRIQIK